MPNENNFKFFSVATELILDYFDGHQFQTLKKKYNFTVG
jgi:hypothetical protein